MSKLDKKYCVISTLIVVLISIMNFSIIFMPVRATDPELDIDGIVDEGDWIWWFFDDESTPPEVNVYWCANSTNLFIGLLSYDDNNGTDLLQFAFRTSENDYWIYYRTDGVAKYRKSGGSWEGWWEDRVYSGLPTGVIILSDHTMGKRSYEISIKTSLWGKNPEYLPDNFIFWYKIQDNPPGGSANYYPNERAGWWFQIEAGKRDKDPPPPKFEEEMPTFHVPEYPLGTILAIASMFASLMIFLKKPNLIKLWH